MRRISEEKLAKLSTTNQMLDEKYGVHGTETRDEFDEDSIAWFYGNMLKERRKELNMTQKEVAENSPSPTISAEIVTVAVSTLG